MRADRQTDMRKVIAAFRNFANAPEKEFGVGLGPSLMDLQSTMQTRDVTLLILMWHNLSGFVLRCNAHPIQLYFMYILCIYVYTHVIRNGV